LKYVDEVDDVDEEIVFGMVPSIGDEGNSRFPEGVLLSSSLVGVSSFFLQACFLRGDLSGVVGSEFLADKS
jgi:hypothetical protein